MNIYDEYLCFNNISVCLNRVIAHPASNSGVNLNYYCLINVGSELVVSRGM